jgi:hypothetical protein
MHRGPATQIFPPGIANMQAQHVAFLLIHGWSCKAVAALAPGKGHQQELAAQQPMQGRTQDRFCDGIEEGWKKPRWLHVANRCAGFIHLSVFSLDTQNGLFPQYSQER